MAVNALNAFCLSCLASAYKHKLCKKIIVPIAAATEATAIAVDLNYKKLRLARELGAMGTITAAFMMLEQRKAIGRVIIIP